MGRFRYSLALVSALTLAACATAPAATGTAQDETALRAMGGKFAEAWNKGDAPAIGAMMTDDYEGVDPDGTSVKGRAAAEAREKEQAATRVGLPVKLNIDTSMLKWINANAASLAGTWTLTGAPAGMGPDKGSWSVLAEKGADGQWRMATGLVAAYVPPPTMPAPAPTKPKTPVKGKAPAPVKGKGRGK